jgi:para-nitrobenzyl esterase
VDQPPRARTTGGTVQGEWRGGVAAFRGIPFAAPPVGEHRFTEPHPPAPWSGVRPAVAFGTAPPQPHRDATGDDWLTLAVWTPDPGARDLPVLVWITGGAYLQCSTANPHHDGTALAAGGAVVVSANYRVGAEGWARVPGYPDNRGLLDQVAALRWVRENIAAFGGDPGNVTVYGQSSGAGSVSSLLVMPRAAGLFERAVVQSLPGTYFTTGLADDVTTRIAAAVAPGFDPRRLVEVDPARLSAAVTDVSENLLPTMADRWGPAAFTPTPFSPVVDGDVLPADPWQGLAAGTSNRVPVLVGHTRDEGGMLAARLGPATAAAVDAMIDGLAPTIRAGYYRAAFPELAPAELREVALGDWLLRMPTLRLAEAAHAGGCPVYLSELCWGHGPDRAAHTLDALLVFGTADALGELTAAGPATVAAADRLASLMRAEYLCFAATGDPGWPRFHPDQPTTRVYDTTPSVRPYPEHRSATLWRDHPYTALELRPTNA